MLSSLLANETDGDEFSSKDVAAGFYTYFLGVIRINIMPTEFHGGWGDFQSRSWRLVYPAALPPLYFVVGGTDNTNGEEGVLYVQNIAKKHICASKIILFL